MKQKKTLTDIAHSTHITLLTLLGFVSVLLGGMSLFVLNHVSLRGYVFQVEAEKRESLLNDISVLETKIAGIDSRLSLKKSSKAKAMIPQNGRYVFIESEAKTAQITTDNNQF